MQKEKRKSGTQSKTDSPTLQEQCLAATYNSLYTNSVLIQYAADTIDYIRDCGCKFKPSVYKILDKITEQIDAYYKSSDERINSKKHTNLVENIGNVVYSKINKKLLIFEVTHLQMLSKNREKHSDIKAKVYVLKIMMEMSYATINYWLSKFSKPIRTSYNTVLDPKSTFDSMKLVELSKLIDRLYGFFSSSVDFSKDNNCCVAKYAYQERLTNPEFIEGCIKQAIELNDGITEKSKHQSEYEDSINKLKEKFNSK